MSVFEPKVLGFLCTWCSYAGADLCGVSRYQYPPNIRVVRVMCSTRLDPAHFLRVLKEGIDGILVGGCHLGDCHYLTGNYHTVHKVDLARRLMVTAGVEPGRLMLEWISASEGQRFSEVVTKFVEQVRALGPNKVPNDPALRGRLEAAIEAASDQRLRILAGRMHAVREVKNVYSQKVPKEQLDRIMDEAVDEVFHRHLVLTRILAEPKSVKQLAKELNVPADKVLKSMISLRAENRVGDAGHVGRSPLYIALNAGGD